MLCDMLPFLDLSAWKSARSGVLIPDEVFGDVVSKAKMDLERRRNEERILTELSEWPGQQRPAPVGVGNPDSVPTLPTSPFLQFPRFRGVLVPVCIPGKRSCRYCTRADRSYRASLSKKCVVEHRYMDAMQL